VNYTQDFFTSRRNYADGDTYVGQLDRLWYDPITNTIRVGNGLPGGKQVHDSASALPTPTAPGDIITFDTVPTILPVGIDDYVLTADSSVATGIAWKPAGTSGIPGTAVTIINGQPTLTLVDTTRNNKILSVAEIPIAYTDNKLKNNEWLRVGNSNHAMSGFIAEFNGTLTFASGQCQRVRNNDKDIHLYINNVDLGSIGSYTGSSNSTFINTTIDIDFNQGDLIRLRAKDGTPGKIEDTVVKLILKWRG